MDLIPPRSSRPHIPALDGLRFLAAFFVLSAHYAHWLSSDNEALMTLSGLGMSLFFVLSGFVIHYNYHHVCAEPGGMKRFFVARFSRLYPLFFVIFSLGFVAALFSHHGACVLTPSHYFIGLPFYLTFTQGWFYGLVCEKSILFQYHLGIDVDWSLSVEAFFYLAYAVFIYRVVSRASIQKNLVIATLVNLAAIGFLVLCWRYNDTVDAIGLHTFGPIASAHSEYDESLLRWLNYFNPYMNLAAFFSGVVAAQLYMHRGNAPQSNVGNGATIASIVLVLFAHFFLYLVVNAHSSFFGRTASSLYVILVAIMLYALARYPHSFCAKAIGSPLLVRLGQASYSIYLLHAFLGHPASLFYNLHPGFLFYALAMIGILGISQLSYHYFERPAQRWLRQRMD